MEIDIKEVLKVGGTAFGVFLLLAMSAMFQVGYFSVIGIQYISFAGLSDWLFVVSTVGPVSIISYLVVDMVLKPLSRLISKRKTSIGALLVGGLVGSLAAIAFLVTLFFKAEPLRHGAKLLIVIGLSIVTWGWGSKIIRSMSENAPVPVNSLAAFLFGMLMVPNLLGSLQASIADTRKCRVSLGGSEALSDVEYLRFVSEGHLVRINGWTHFLSKERAKEISCKYP